MNNNICKLCKLEIADKKNSHIISKFLGKGLFDGKNNKYTLQIKVGKAIKVQDTVKEDNILCTSCEKIIEKVETYSANSLARLQLYKKLPNEFIVNSLGNLDTLECNNINPYIFKLFVYSLIFRISISKNEAYSSFLLEENIIEEIRVFLCNNLKFIENYKTSPNLFLTTPDYHFVVYMKEDMSKGIRGVQGAVGGNNNYCTMLGDYIIFFYTRDNVIKQYLKIFSNKQNNHVNIILQSSSQWQDFMFNVLSKYN